MKYHIFMKYYSLVFVLLSAGLAINNIYHHNYRWAILFVVCTFMNHVTYDYHKNKIKQYRNEKDNSENPPQVGR